MRASSHSPFRTMLMIIPMIAIAVLASMGGYHYHTFAASQADHSSSDFGNQDIIIHDQQPNHAPQGYEEDLLSDAPVYGQQPAHNGVALNEASQAPGHSAQPVNNNHQMAAVDRREQYPDQPRQRRPRPQDDNRAYPYEALEGYQIADGHQSQGTQEVPRHFTETSATRDFEAEFDAAFDQTAASDNGDSQLQAAIDARRNHLEQMDDSQGRRQRPAAAQGGRVLRDSSPRIVLESDPEPQPADIEPPYRDPRTLKEAAQILREWGIRRFKLESVSEGTSFRFLCGVTDVHNPSIRRLFVADGEEPLAAVRNALRQIEDWRAQQ